MEKFSALYELSDLFPTTLYLPSKCYYYAAFIDEELKLKEVK